MGVQNTQVLSGRFHYCTHRCCSIFDPGTLQMCDNMVNSIAEALNRRWSASRTHMRYLSGNNLIQFIYARSIFLNLRTYVRDTIQL